MPQLLQRIVTHHPVKGGTIVIECRPLSGPLFNGYELCREGADEEIGRVRQEAGRWYIDGLDRPFATLRLAVDAALLLDAIYWKPKT